MNTITSQVILASGELYPKSNLHPGMMLFGADSKIHKLRGLTTHKILAFDVQPQKGKHFLIGFDQKILAFSRHKEPLLLRATDIRDFSRRFQRNFSLAKVSLDFPKQELPLDPYVLGLLLADGSYFKKSCLKSNTKFIPKSYLYADRHSREALLAGLLDTSGFLKEASYDYQTSSVQEAEDIAFLARSLGLSVVEGKTLHTRGIVARLYLHGDFSQLPLRRKIGPPRRKPFHETFKLKPVGVQDILYLDIESYVQGDFTVRMGDSQPSISGGAYDNA